MRRWTIFMLLLLIITACQKGEPVATGFLHGDFAYTAYQNQVKVINVANETAPQFVTEIELPGNVMKVETDGRYLYIAHSTNASSWDSRSGPPNAGLQIADISNPAQPQNLGHFYTKGLPTDLVLYGDFVYLATRDYIDIINVRNREAPRHLATFFEGGNTLMRSGEQMVASWGGCNFRTGSCGGGFNLFTLDDPKAITQIAHFQTNQIPAYDVALSNGYAFGTGKGMWATDLANLDQLQINGRYELNNGFLYPAQIIVDGTIAYVTQFDGLHIMDVSEPTNPTLLGIYPTSNQLTDLALRNGRIYLVGWSGLEIVDVTNTAAPKLLGYHATDYPAQIFPQPTATP
ncbi:LVIVD repeat-containing protein [Candidatus Leptofilum sp.]|uniref:LVIVD repeat-containing protein n=1 Tax=Candidatus Leptofilum sp. TaxID=3241576 RepID=UPI003B5C73B5